MPRPVAAVRYKASIRSGPSNVRIVVRHEHRNTVVHNIFWCWVFAEEKLRPKLEVFDQRQKLVGGIGGFGLSDHTRLHCLADQPRDGVVVCFTFAEERSGAIKVADQFEK